MTRRQSSGGLRSLTHKTSKDPSMKGILLFSARFSGTVVVWLFILLADEPTLLIDR